MAAVLRGDLYWANLSPVRGHEQGGLRPVLVISHDELNARAGAVIVLAITSREQKAGYPLTYRLQSGGLPKESWVKISQVRTISIERIHDRIGTVNSGELAEILDGLIELVAIRPEG